MKKFFLALTLVALIAPTFVLAQQVNPNDFRPKVITNVNAVADIIGRIASFLLGIMIAISVLFIFLAAWRYLTAQGDPEKVKKANQTLLYAAIAIAVAILAGSLPYIVNSLLTQGGIQ